MISKETHRAPSWHKIFLAFNQWPFIRHLFVLSFALIGTSLLYLVAANWFMLPDLVQLAIPQVLLVLSAGVSIYVKQDYLIQSLHSFCALMLGLSLAVIGQIYQTGADSYLLFTVWAALLLPWLYRCNIGVFLLLSMVSQLALYLGFKQTFWMQEAEFLYFVCAHVVTVVQFYFCLKFYPALRYLFIAWVGGLSAWMMFKFLADDGGFYFVLSMALPLLYFTYFFQKKYMLESSLTLVIVGLNLTFWIFENLGKVLGGIGIEIAFIYALVIFIWFALISYILIKILPQNRFYILPLAVGGWIAGLLLASAILTFWGVFSLIMGIVFMIVAAILLKKQQGAFVRQLAYCLLISGQVAFLGHLYSEVNEIFLLLLCQLPLLVLLIYLRVHWFFLFIQLLALYGLAASSIFDFNRTLSLQQSAFNEILVVCNYLFFALFFCVGYIKEKSYCRSVMATLLLICIVSHFIIYAEVNWLGDHVQAVIWENYLCALVWAVFCFGMFLSKQLNHLASILLFIFVAILTYIGTFEIFIVLCILSWAIQQKDKIIYALALLIFTLLLWHMYYSLELSFLLKSLTLFLSGIFLYVLAHILSRAQVPEMQEYHT